ncbi:hypothetical protein CEE37_05635 [candidate division LCP-89 bacterium B3_LCP]|uniref:Secretion system C-terminal sorting domain-containing protein n=1 Tax=candidate division LCP-89 bacterium B3_LCP TaxID=2012998 RepID=A0A532V1Y3_UNCL8|nr:MAG: hypothetical protein CEE37_05635 [candidate division LCP-89 bacterium B3_LCP]
MKRPSSILALIILISYNNTFAETITVSGDVSGTWSADTVLVVGEVRVPQEQTLVIEPGVKVLFQGLYKLIVDTMATLQAVGTEQDSIKFDVTPPGFLWHGIRFYSSSQNSILEYCLLQKGHSWDTGHDNSLGGAIFCSNAPLVLHNCIIENCAAATGGGIACINNSSLEVIDCVIRQNISHCGSGIMCYESNATIKMNQIVENAGSDWGDGIGIYCKHSNAIILENLIADNIALTSFGNEGGGIYCMGGEILIKNNIISDNYSSQGAGIYCKYSDNTRIIGNTIRSNEQGSGVFIEDSGVFLFGNLITENEGSEGGGIYLSSDPGCYGFINKNIISGNTAVQIGGIKLDYFTGDVSKNIIYQNSANSTCGGMWIGQYSDGTICHENIIAFNHANGSSGGLHCFAWTPTISENIIIGNTASYTGGGIYCHGHSYPTVMFNGVFENYVQGGTSLGAAGGIYFGPDSHPSLSNNTICFNIGDTLGTGIYCNEASPTLTNAILWQNESEQILTSISANPEVTYSTIQDTLWPGIGNINEDPLFVNPDLNDYRLQWGSPCIDTGDPSPQYNDPDSTRADMGAFYFDQSVPVRILLSPHEIPYLIEPEGGTMDYTIQGTNIFQSSHDVTIWCDVELPDSTIYGPVLGPVTITIEPGQTVERIRTQTVPAAAPMGVYHYNAYAVVDQDTSKDSFMFGKLGTVTGGSDGWGNAGDPLITIGGGSTPALQETHVIAENYPNPFNATTVISFSLPVASMVKLEVFDISGSRVGVGLVPTRQYPSGTHQITFDGTNLSSGVYLYQLEAGDFSAMGKMVLMK